MKKVIILLLFVCSFSVSAGIRIGMKFNDHGELIPPDQILIRYALKSDKDGFKESAMRFLKESARYGNQEARYFVGLLYLQQKDWARGYAWLKLVRPGVFDLERLRPKVESLMTTEEKAQADITHKQLKGEYSDLAGLAKREAWRRKLSFTGTRIKGGKNIINFRIQTASGAVVAEKQLEDMLDSFVYEYDYNLGNVKLGTLELIEESKQEDVINNDEQ